MKTIETKISKSGATIYYVDGKRTSRENAMFVQRMNEREARWLANIEAEKAEREDAMLQAVVAPAALDAEIELANKADEPETVTDDSKLGELFQAREEKRIAARHASFDSDESKAARAANRDVEEFIAKVAKDLRTIAPAGLNVVESWDSADLDAPKFVVIELATDKRTSYSTIAETKAALTNVNEKATVTDNTVADETPAETDGYDETKMTTIETKVSANGAVNVYVNGKRTSNEKAVQIARANGLPTYNANCHTYADNYINETFATPVAAYRWLLTKANNNINFADGSWEIEENHTVIYEHAGDELKVANAELEAYILTLDNGDAESIKAQIAEFAKVVKAENETVNSDETDEVKAEAARKFADKLFRVERFSQKQVDTVVAAILDGQNADAVKKLIDDFKTTNFNEAQKVAQRIEEIVAAETVAEAGAEELPAGTIEVDGGAKAFELAAKYFPDGLKFKGAHRWVNGAYEYTFTDGNDKFLHATCDRDNTRVECLEVVDTNESGSKRKPLFIIINPPEISEVDAAETVTENVTVTDEIDRAVKESIDDYCATVDINGETLSFEDGQLSEVASTRYGAYFKVRNGRKNFYYRGNRVSKQDFFGHIETEDRAAHERAAIAKFVDSHGGSEIKPGTNPQANFVAQIHPTLANGRQDGYEVTFDTKDAAHNFITEFKALAGDMKFIAKIKRGSFYGEVIYRHGFNGKEFFAPVTDEHDEDGFTGEDFLNELTVTLDINVAAEKILATADNFRFLDQRHEISLKPDSEIMWERDFRGYKGNRSFLITEVYNHPDGTLREVYLRGDGLPITVEIAEPNRNMKLAAKIVDGLNGTLEFLGGGFTKNGKPTVCFDVTNGSEISPMIRVTEAFTDETKSNLDYVEVTRDYAETKTEKRTRYYFATGNVDIDALTDLNGRCNDILKRRHNLNAKMRLLTNDEYAGKLAELDSEIRYVEVQIAAGRFFSTDA